MVSMTFSKFKKGFIIGLLALIVVGSTLVISSRNLGDLLYDTNQFTLAQKSYQIHYSVFGDDQSLVGLFISSRWLQDYDLIVRLFPQIEKEMFDSNWEYGRVMADYLIALYYTTPETSLDSFFKEMDRLYPDFLEFDWANFFTPFTDIIVTGSDDVLKKMNHYIEDKLNEFPTPKMQAVAYTIMATTYSKQGDYDKAEEMTQNAEQLDPQ